MVLSWNWAHAIFLSESVPEFIILREGWNRRAIPPLPVYALEITCWKSSAIVFIATVVMKGEDLSSYKPMISGGVGSDLT